MSDKVRDLALMMYADEPCRICQKTITPEDAETAVFVGYSDNMAGRAAHLRCWQGFLDVLRTAPADKLATARIGGL